MKSKMLLCFLSLFMAAAGASANERIYVNREVTTHIVMPENIKMVDISTTKIAGNQCTDNIVRIKPSCGSDSIPEAGYRDNELLGTLTLSITLAMAAIGLGCNVVKLIKNGGKPILLGGCCWIGITCVSLLLQHVLSIW